MSFIIPLKAEILEAMRIYQHRPLLDKVFGERWFERLDPRMYLGITYEEFQQYVVNLGIPKSLLVEDTDTGDDHFVIYKENGKWIVGFAERGSVHTKSSHQSKELARLEVISRIWHGLDIDMNPEHFKNGVNAGTMVDMAYSERVIDKAIERIIKKYSLNDTIAKDYAIKAIEALESHGGDVNDIHSIYQVIDVVVRSWIEQ